MSNICPSNPCDSKATCFNTTDNETLCLCTSGFTGLRCSVNKQCPPSNKFVYLERRPGDLGLSFCSGSYPSTTFHLCVDGNYSSYWSGEASLCEEENGTFGTMTSNATQDSLPDPQSQGTLKTKPINFDDYPFVIPFVIIIAILVQILLPFVLWRYASCKRKYKEAKNDHRRTEHSRIGLELKRIRRVLGIAVAADLGMVDTIFADVAQPDQARIVAINAHNFLKNGGHFVISIKANCIDSTAEPAAVFAGEVKKMQAEKMKPQEQLTLEPYERDHAVVVGIYRPPPKKDKQ
ncbi:hypothetical protein ACROYT_G027215 [Oculina patagonica]